MRTLKFNYYDEFACTGPECEDSCCKHWMILLTKREYLDYKKLDCSPELKSIIDSAFKRKKDGTDLAYAQMALKEDGSCPFLGEDKLCRLQKEKGESVLTHVCSVFPRHWQVIGTDAAVFTLSPTCYHVVELLMQHPEGLVLTEDELDIKNPSASKILSKSNYLPTDSEMYPYIWTIKTAQIDILQNRNFTIPERLLILGYYTQKASEYLENSPEKLEPLSSMMMDTELIRKIADSLKVKQTDVQSASKSANILFKVIEYMRRAYPDLHTTKLLNIIAEKTGLIFEPNDKGEYDISVDFGKLSQNFEVYSEIEADRPYLIENLLVNQAFMTFSAERKNLWQDYFSLVILYNFLQFYTNAFLSENYTDKELAMAITYMVKILINARVAETIVMNDFTGTGTNSLSHVAFLIN